MPVTKKRKVSATTSKSASTPRGIAAFTKVSKSQVTTKSILDKTLHANSITAVHISESTDLEKKRKSVTVEEIEVEDSADQPSEILSATGNKVDRDIKPLPQRRSTDSQRLPQTPRKPIQLPGPPSPVETPTKGARSLLDRLLLSSSSPADETSSPLRSETSSITDIDSLPCKSVINYALADTTCTELPSELLDLINLHASFLTALALHYAHNGTHTPADLRSLCPNVARAWGKRRVLLLDIRRTLAIQNLNFIPDEEETTKSGCIPLLTLSDYGHGKICVEIKSTQGKLNRIARTLDEDQLNASFVQNLLQLWNGRPQPKSETLAFFISSLPSEPITTCSSLTQMSPLLLKGKRRLEDLKAGVKPSKSALRPSTSTSSTNSTPTKPTLLDRLRAKSLHVSSLPAPPTPTQLSRKAALHRLPEIISILTVLSTSTSIGQSRISFTLPTVLGKLKDSMKLPISKEEGERCVTLLAEVAPEWVSLVRMGKKGDAVVVCRKGWVGEREMGERIRRAGEE